MIVDLDAVTRAIADIAATEIVPRYGKLSEDAIGTKSGPQDFVTEADHAAEDALARVLSDIYPAAKFVGEERAASDPDLVSGLDSDDAFWIVDPVDGTRNFIEQRDEFGTIVALVEGREIRAGWVYAVLQQKCAVASLGDGAAWDGQALSALEPPAGPLRGQRAIGSFKEPWKSLLPDRMREAFETEPTRCSAFAYLRMAQGHRDFGLFSRSHPWDHAAGVLILREIGGVATYLDTGKPYTAVDTLGRPLLVSGSQDRFDRVRETLMEGVDVI
ncbi:MAG: inositol monophosphatase family protein [Pseudomonadota bacterium]